MSVPREKQNALIATRALLHALIIPAYSPGIPSEIREMAQRCARHYPMLYEIGGMFQKELDFERRSYDDLEDYFRSCRKAFARPRRRGGRPPKKNRKAGK